MTPTQEKALLEAVMHLLDDYDNRLDSTALTLTDQNIEYEMEELSQFRARLERLRTIISDGAR